MARKSKKLERPQPSSTKLEQLKEAQAGNSKKLERPWSRLLSGFRLRQARGHGLSSFIELPALLSMKWAHVAVAGPTMTKINKINGLGRSARTRRVVWHTREYSNNVGMH
ncbi:hypothetical protein NL676_010632 [Syzygium grande]|nr:hypothetical protein NL676_010632 [Syzygium grande]